MTRSPTSRNITIFEGPDGAGKSTLGREFAELTGAAYIHHGPYKEVGNGLARLFLESMLPALLGYQDVVLDRCWLSEPIYADVFRGGHDRVGPGRSQILDRIALRCGAAVIRCLPPFETIKATFNARRDEEYLDDDYQLSQVYNLYAGGLRTSLPTFFWDYTRHPAESVSSQASTLRGLLDREVAAWRRKSLHPLRARSSGNWDGKIVIVGENFGEVKNTDALYQTPFGSFSGVGCSLWLAEQLVAHGIREVDLLWINADQLTLPFVDAHASKHWVLLGGDSDVIAKQALDDTGRYGRTKTTTLPHPQYWKRFKSKELYPLIPLLKELL